jgi:3-oxoacyl-[acyl-carrier protein] reductase
MSDLYLITGSSGGIGAAIAKVLHAQGHLVCLTGRNRQRLCHLSTELRGSISFVCDLRQPSQIEDLAQFIESRGEPLKVLVNNAGIFAKTVPRNK